jgi:dTMP kinase
LSLFVTIEGTEGSGKTTQVRLLADALGRRDLEVVVTREPGGTELGERLRGLLLESTIAVSPEAEAYLMTAARAQHVRDVIRPALERGAVVLCDRFADSTFAYQGAGRGLPIEALQGMQQLAVDQLTPDVTLLLDLPVAIGLARRARERDGNRIDQESFAFHERVAAWYRSAAAAEPGRWRIIDATMDPAVMHTAILGCVVSRLTSVVACLGHEGKAP